jgi:protein subunit release factor B
MLGVGGGNNNRRSRIVDLEEMMLMEAIRLSLAEEEERKRREKEKEEEEARKKGKGKEREDQEEGDPERGFSSLAEMVEGDCGGEVEGKGKVVVEVGGTEEAAR